MGPRAAGRGQGRRRRRRADRPSRGDGAGARRAPGQGRRDGRGDARLGHASMAELQELIGRAASYAGLRFAVDTSDPVERGAHATGAGAGHDDHHAADLVRARVGRDRRRAADLLLADERVEPYRYHLESARRYRPHLLTEPEEKIDTEKDVTGRSAWVRLFSELSAEITITLPDGTEVPLERGLSMMMHPDRETRRRGRGCDHRGPRSRPAHASVHLQHAARRQGDRRSTPPLPHLDHEPEPGQPGERRERRGARRRGEAALRHPAALVRDEEEDPRAASPRRLRPVRVGGGERDRRSDGSRRATWCSTRTRRSRPSSLRSPAGSSTSAGSMRPCDPASDPARSARTPSPHTIRTCS